MVKMPEKQSPQAVVSKSLSLPLSCSFPFTLSLSLHLFLSLSISFTLAPPPSLSLSPFYPYPPISWFLSSYRSTTVLSFLPLTLSPLSLSLYPDPLTHR